MRDIFETEYLKVKKGLEAKVGLTGRKVRYSLLIRKSPPVDRKNGNAKVEAGTYQRVIRK